MILHGFVWKAQTHIYDTQQKIKLIKDLILRVGSLQHQLIQTLTLMINKQLCLISALMHTIEN